MGGLQLAGYFFLPWVFRDISPTRVFAGGDADRWQVSGRHWSSSGAVEQPRTAQRRPSLRRPSIVSGARSRLPWFHVKTPILLGVAPRNVYANGVPEGYGFAEVPTACVPLESWVGPT